MRCPDSCCSPAGFPPETLSRTHRRGRWGRRADAGAAPREATRLQGQATLEGRAIENALLVFCGASGTAAEVRVRTDEHGRFTLVGVSYGTYRVEVTGSDGDPVGVAKATVGPGDEALALEVKRSSGR